MAKIDEKSFRDDIVKRDVNDPVENDIEVNECDGCAPNGGLALGDLPGMGPMTFPGANPDNGFTGVRGSGDIPLPSPTGVVYTQVMPYGLFVKSKKKGGKKRKKFDKKDEPCAHSNNPPIYDYVDDYRDYVDRIYKRIK